MVCENCPNKIQIPGNAWIGCSNTTANKNIRNVPWGGIYPISFDENIILECNGKDIIVVPTKNPLLDLVRILGAR